jgi:hypothetical protein
MIRETFLAPLYSLRVENLGPQHAIRTKCMCGAGPWYLHGFWLRQRFRPTEHLRGIVQGLRCPNCGALDLMAWTMVEAVND